MADFGITELLAAGSAALFGGGEAAAATTALAAPAVAGTAISTTALPAAALAAVPSAAVGGASFLPSLSTVGSVVGLGGTLLSAKAGLDQASYQAAVDRANAVALGAKANEDASAGERAAITQSRKTELVLSRARALAAASGTDATSPDILKTEADIAGQGAYNAQSALYEGLARSRSDTYQADIDLFRARETARAAPIAAGGTILAGLSNLASSRARLKYYSLAGPSFGGF